AAARGRHRPCRLARSRRADGTRRRGLRHDLRRDARPRFGARLDLSRPRRAARGAPRRVFCRAPRRRCALRRGRGGTPTPGRGGARALEEGGARVVEREVKGMELAPAGQFNTIAPEATAVHAQRVREHPEGFGEETRVHLEVGNFLPGPWYVKAQRWRTRIVR